jgi:hypothetical protein
VRRRSALRIATPALGLLLAGALAGCGSATSSSSTTSNSSTSAAAAAAISPASPVGSVTVQSRTVSLDSVRRQIALLYQKHPAVARFATQDVSYTPRSRARVLASCSGDGRQEGSEAVESSRVLACAPLIYFFFSYGRQDGVSEARTLADAIYSYASSSIRGPQDAESMLGSILQGWGVPVSDATSAPASGKSSPAATALTGSVRRAILGQRSARVAIIGYQSNDPHPVATISAVIGARSGAETMREESAGASIRVTADSVFLSGNTAGLADLLGLPSSRTRGADGRWLQVSKGSAEYRDLATENTIAALPASLLPTSSDTVTETRARDHGRTVRVLRWSGADGSDPSATLTATLTVNPTSSLPISELTTSPGHRQTVTFGRWNQPVNITAPYRSIPLPAG